MFAHGLILALVALGHAALVVLAVNVAHGLGFRSRSTEPITLGALGLLGFATLAGLGWMASHPVAEWPWALRLYAGACLLIGLLGVPATSIGLRLRRPPAGVSTGTRRLNPDDLAPAASGREELIGRGPNARLLLLPRNDSLGLVVRDCRVEMPGLPPALDGVSLVQLADLHMSPCYNRRYFEAVAERAAALEPDLVLCTGDVVEHLDAIAWIEPVLGRVRGRLGQFAILGNHDLLYDPARIRAALEAAGYTDVDGRWTRIEHGDAAIAVGGTSAPWGPRLRPAEMPEGDLRLVLSHTPDQFDRIRRWDAVDLVLCGHNHGGQVRLPLIGPVLMPSRYSRRFDRGFFRAGRTTMYVSQGIGAKHPIRWNCPPELTRIVLRSTARPSPAGRLGDAEGEPTALRGGRHAG